MATKALPQKWKKPHKRAIRFYGRSLNLIAFATKYGISKAYLSKILHGHRAIDRMSVRMALKLSAAFGVPLESLQAYIAKGMSMPPLTETYRSCPTLRQKMTALAAQKRSDPPEVSL